MITFKTDRVVVKHASSRVLARQWVINMATEMCRFCLVLFVYSRHIKITTQQNKNMSIDTNILASKKDKQVIHASDKVLLIEHKETELEHDLICWYK